MMGSGGARGLGLQANSNYISTNLQEGDPVAKLSNPFAIAGTTYSVIGTIPDQLTLLGDTLYRGVASAVVDEIYTVVIRAENGVRAIEEPLTFIGRLAPPTVVLAPAITGTPQEGQVLTTSDGTWTGSPSTFDYQWYRNAVPIPGETGDTYVCLTADIGAALSVAVVAHNAAGASSPALSAATALVNPAPDPVPVNTTLPAISGTPKPGQTLTVSDGVWDNAPTGYSYQWRRDGVNIPGETANTYLVLSSDPTKAITCRVTAVNAGGSTTAVSVGINILQPDLSVLTLSSSPIPEGAAAGTVVGTVGARTAGSTFTLADNYLGAFAIDANTGQITVNDGSVLDYETDSGPQIIVRETLAGSENSPKDTQFTILLTNVVNPTWSVAPSISGSATLGSTLTGTDGSINDGALQGRQWLRNGAPIPGATNSTYVLVDADLNATITLRETAVNAIGEIATSTSAGVGPITDLPPITVAGTPTVAVIGSPYSFAFTANGPTQITSGASDLTQVGLSTYNQNTNTLSGTP